MLFLPPGLILDPKLVFGQQLQAIATESKMTTGPFVYFGNFVSVKNENKPEEGLGKYLLAVAAQKILDRQWSGACIVVPTNKISVYARMGFVCDAHTRRMPGYTIPAWFMKITPQDLLNAAGLDPHKAWRSRMMTRHARLRLMDPANVSRTLRNTAVYEIIEPIEYKP